MQAPVKDRSKGKRAVVVRFRCRGQVKVLLSFSRARARAPSPNVQYKTHTVSLTNPRVDEHFFFVSYFSYARIFSCTRLSPSLSVRTERKKKTIRKNILGNVSGDSTARRVPVITFVAHVQLLYYTRVFKRDYTFPLPLALRPPSRPSRVKY